MVRDYDRHTNYWCCDFNLRVLVLSAAQMIPNFTLMHKVDGVAVAWKYSVFHPFYWNEFAICHSNFKLNSREYWHWKALYIQLESFWKSSFWEEKKYLQQACKIKDENCTKMITKFQTFEVHFYHDLSVMTLDSFNSFTVTVKPQSVLWKYTITICDDHMHL